MSIDFDKYAVKGNEILNLLANDLQIQREKAGRILRAVLHAIRNHISVQESAQLIAQLPMAIKGLYVDHWNPSWEAPRIHHVKEFLEEIRSCDNGLAVYDFGDDDNASRSVKAVFRTLNYYLSPGEFEDIIAVLPREIKEFVAGSVGYSRMAL